MDLQTPHGALRVVAPTPDMDAVRRVAGGIARYFNAELCVVLGYADFVLSHLPQAHTFREDILEIKRASSHCADLIESLMVFSGECHHRIAHLDLLVAIAEICGSIEANRRILTSLPGDLWDARVDPRWFRRLMDALISNALEATRRGGGVSVAARNLVIAADHDSLAAGEYIELDVADNGEGIQTSDAERIFEPFFTTKADPTTPGMGLAMAHCIVTALGGAIGVASTPGQGTTVRVYLPRSGGAQVR